MTSNPSITALLKTAQTGERPILCLASDGKEYWCKSFDGLGAFETPVNEIVSIEVGRAIGAPVCNWSIIDVPEELAQSRFEDSIISALPLFGSENLPSVYEHDFITHVKDDNNQHRLPLLIALWYLCNAEDIQMIYDLTSDFSVFSIDQGYWFSSHEGNRYLAPEHDVASKTQVPKVPQKIEAKHWDYAIQQVKSLDVEKLKHISEIFPQEWEIEPRTINEMIEYVLSRKEYTVARLRYHQNH